MKLCSLIYAFTTLIAVLAADTDSSKAQAPASLATIRVTLQCRDPDCKNPLATPILTQIKDGVTVKSSPATYIDEIKALPIIDAGVPIGYITLNTSLAGTQDFRVDGDHIFKSNDLAKNPSTQIQGYNLACTVALPPMLDRRDSMNGKVYELDLQNKMEGEIWDLQDGICVHCWKSLPTRVRETDRFVTPFQLNLVSRCNSPPGETGQCKEDGQTLPIISYAQDDTHFVATTGHFDTTNNPEIKKASTFQVAQLTFDYPTLDYTTQLPLPKILTMGNYEDKGNRTFDCEIRILNKPAQETEELLLGEVVQTGYFDLGGKTGGVFAYCYETIWPPV